jgi:hypothetical protein
MVSARIDQTMAYTTQVARIKNKIPRNKKYIELTSKKILLN